MVARRVFLALALLALLAPCALALTLWPQPSSVASGTVSLSVAADFKFGVDGSTESDTLRSAFDRYAALIFAHTATSTRSEGVCVLSALVFSVDSQDESHPQLETDESYSLQIPSCDTGPAPAVATAHAQTVYGALRALETFSQLVAFNFDAGIYSIHETPISVQDAPRFPHRGLMIDTSRHYQPLPALRALIDSLPYAKLNVLHWHVSDTQSFPLEVRSHPRLWTAAFTPAERYTQADVAAVVEYARARGVRVMVEFDMPGHAQSWCVGYPEVCPSSTCTTPLNVARNATFDFVATLLAEMTGGRRSQPNAPSGLFPDTFLHLGGDEVNTTCWGKSLEIVAWMAAHNLTEDGAYAYFVGRASDMAIAQGRRPVQWSEVFDHFKGKLNKQTIVHVWKDVTNVTEVVALGYDVLRNVGYDNISWYLDNLDVTWQGVYSNEPCSGIPDALCPRVLGGHGEMWGESVDASDVQATVWPKLAAIAEKLWSPAAFTNAPGFLKAAHPRLQRYRCMLLQRGVGAAPVDNANAREGPPSPGSCMQ